MFFKWHVSILIFLKKAILENLNKKKKEKEKNLN